MKNKLIFGILYLSLLCLGIFTIYKNIPVGTVFTNAYISNLLQRVFGLTIFSMLFVQIILGNFMQRLTEKYGGWLFTFHVFEGVLIYALLLAHTASFMLFNYFTGHGLDPFYVIADVCVLCDPAREYYITLGRLGLWFMTATIATAILRIQTPFLRLHWRKFHYLNYLIFIFAAVHAFALGTDTLVAPFSYVFYPATAITALLGGTKLFYAVRKFRWN